jgi:multiple sugar transport system substrate-binding protein
MIKRIALLGLVCVFLVTNGALCGKASLTPPTRVTLTIWRSEDSSNDLVPATDAYRAQFPHVSFDVKTFAPEEYEDALLSAWAKGEGPDIFSVPNWRLGKFKEFISPMPQFADLKTTHTEKSFGKTTVVVDPKTTVFPSVAQIQDRFVDVVASDVVDNNLVYGLPYSMDTLVLYYNRDLMARSQIAVAPTTWEEFRNDVEAMVVRDDKKNVIQPAAAIGTAENIPHFMDLLSVIMMQDGTQMAAEDGTPTFAGEFDDHVPGAEAFDFYLKFSSPKWTTFTWDNTQLNALEAFTQGNLGFYFGYLSDLETIKGRAPSLNFSYAKIPQVDTGNPVNFANYSIESVHINSANPCRPGEFLHRRNSSSARGL